jgi:hypothetical protein
MVKTKEVNIFLFDCVEDNGNTYTLYFASRSELAGFKRSKKFKSIISFKKRVHQKLITKTF